MTAIVLKDRYSWAYIFCSIFSNIGFYCAALSSNLHPLYGYITNGELFYRLYTPYIIVGGCGFILGGLFFDRILKNNPSRWRFSIILSAITVVPLGLRMLTDSYVLYSICTLVYGFLGFAVSGVVLGGLFNRVSYRLKPLTYGISFCAAALLRFPFDLRYQGGGEGSSLIYGILAIAGYLLYCAAVSLKPFKRAFSEPETSVVKRVSASGADNKLLIMAIVSSIIVYLLFGVYDVLSTNSPIIGDYITYVRILQLFAPVLCGLVCLKFGHYPSVLISIFLLGMGSLAAIFSFSGVAALVLSLMNMAGISFFQYPVRSLFADIGTRGKYPYTSVAAGFGIYYITLGFGPVIGDTVQAMGQTGGVALYIAMFMVSVPVVMLFFAMLRSSGSASAQLSIAAAAQLSVAAPEPKQNTNVDELPLTRREKEILRLILQGLISREIAEALFVSESTINWHVGNILKKTGNDSRAALIKSFSGETE